MNIETEIRDDHQVKLVVELDMESQERFMHRAARAIAKDTRIPGFRPGKAPYDVVKRHFGEKRIEEQAVEILLEDIYPKALEEAKIEPSGPGQLESYPTFTPPKLIFIVPLKPEVVLGDYQSIRIDYKSDPVTEEDLAQMVRRLQSSRGVTAPAERPAEENDMVYLLLNSQFSQPEEGETPEITKDQPLEILIDPEEDPNADPWPFPAFSKELIGMEANDEKTVTYSFPKDAQFEKLKEREVDFHIQIQSVKSVEKPEVDDDFIKSFGDFETVDEFHEMLRNQMESSKAQEYEEGYLTEVIDMMIDQSSCKYPPHMLEEEIQETLKSIEQKLVSQHMDLPTYLKTLDTDKESYIEEEIKPNAEKQLIRTLVLEEILRNEKIQLDSAQLQNAVAQTMNIMQSTQGREQVPRGMKKQDLISGLTFETANRMLNEQLMGRLKAIASGEIEAEAAKAEAEAKAEAKAIAKAEKKEKKEAEAEAETKSETGTKSDAETKPKPKAKVKAKPKTKPKTKTKKSASTEEKTTPVPASDDTEFNEKPADAQENEPDINTEASSDS